MERTASATSLPENPTVNVPLKPDELHIWSGRHDGADSKWLAWCLERLSESERERLGAIGHDGKRREQILARGSLREVLSQVTGQAASAIELLTTGRGKPCLAPATAMTVEFNLSHTAQWLAIAVTQGRRVGIDVEEPRPLPAWNRVARRYFSTRENAALDALPPSRREQAFLTCWVRKEALVKATGGGIASGLGGFDVTVDPDEPARLLDSRTAALVPADWHLADLSLEAPALGAVAVEGHPAPRPVHHRLPRPSD